MSATGSPPKSESSLTMSKCDFQIVFDRTDCTYRAGEPVRGTIQVEMDRDITRCALVVAHLWRTHGRGNATIGGKWDMTLPAMEFRAGETRRIPFEFVAPNGPPTFHGAIVNVDHYVEVSADIPWAIDPRKEESYILQPASPGGQGLASSKPAGRGCTFTISLLGLVLLGAMLNGISLLWLHPPGNVIMLLFGTLMMVLGIREMMVKSRVGDIQVKWGPLRVHPGDQAPVHIRITPRKSFTINSVSVTLVGEERCVSGHRRSRRSHSSVFYERTFPLSESTQAVAGRTLEISGVYDVPLTKACTFHMDDNSICWRVTLRIDIPSWPDWTSYQDLTVLPAKAAPMKRTLVNFVAPPREGLTSPVPPASDTSPDCGTVEVEEPPPRPVGGKIAGTPVITLNDLLAEILAAPRYGSERGNVVAKHAQHTFGCQLLVERIAPTSGDVAEAFQDGRTLLGVLTGSNCKIALQLRAICNVEAESLQAGQTFHTQVTPLRWDTIYERMILRQT